MEPRVEGELRPDQGAPRIPGCGVRLDFVGTGVPGKVLGGDWLHVLLRKLQGVGRARTAGEGGRRSSRGGGSVPWAGRGSRRARRVGLTELLTNGMGAGAGAVRGPARARENSAPQLNAPLTCCQVKGGTPAAR